MRHLLILLTSIALVCAINVAPAADEVPVVVTTSVDEATVATAEAPKSAAPEAPIAESKPASGLSTFGMILSGILTFIVAIVAGFMKKKFSAEADKAKIDTTKSLMEQKNFIIDQRLIPFAISTGEHWLLTQLPAIIADATDGNGFQWKNHYEALKAYMKDRVVKKFAAENLDIIEQIGAEELDNLLDRLIMKLISKLPDSVKAFLPESVIDMLTDQVSKFAVEKGKELIGVK